MFRIPWDETQPLGTYPADVIDDEIRNVKKAIADRMRTITPGWADDDEEPKEFPGWILRKNVTQNVLSGALTKVIWEVISRESGDYVGTAPVTLISIPSGLQGLYMIGGASVWDSVFTFDYDLFIKLNGNFVAIDRHPVPTNANPTLEVNRPFQLGPLDELELEVFQNTGFSQDIDTVGTYFWGIRLGG